MTDTESPAKPTAPYDRIGGWLFFVAIGVIGSPIRFLISLIRDILPAFSGGVWPKLTTPGGELYHPLWAPLLVSELVLNVIFIALSIFIAILFFQKRKRFKPLMLGFLLSNLLLVVADYVIAGQIPAVASQRDPESLKEVFRTLVGCAVWVPYLLSSKRVKGTFVR